MANVLVVAPHPDDEVLGCGIALQHHASIGDDVTVCIISNRAYGHEYDVSNDTREKDHAEKAISTLMGNVSHKVVFCNMKDERLDVSCQDILVQIESVYSECQPDIVYLPWIGDMNQDHKAVFVAGTVLCRPHQKEMMPSKVLAYEVPSSTDQAFYLGHSPFRPTLYVPATTKEVMKKITAMNCYETESRKWPHSRSPDGIMTYAKWRGMESGLDMAEAFMVLRDITGVTR